MASENHAPGYVPNPNYTQEDWDDVHSPELTDEQLAQGRPLAEVTPDLVEAMRKRRGPQKAATKALLSLRLDRDVIDGFRATGPGWQGRMNALLWLAADIEANPGVDGFDIVPGKHLSTKETEEDEARRRRVARADLVSRALQDLARKVDAGHVEKADAERVGELINQLRGLRLSEIDLLADVIHDAKAA